jgi:hypothetical protein
MEKLYSLLWILVAIVVVIYRLVKKMQQTSEREAHERPQRPGSVMPQLPTVTFQELLKQMQARNTQPEATPTAEPVAAPRKKEARTPAGRVAPSETARPAQSQERTAVLTRSLEVRTPVPVLGAALPRASAEAPMEDYWQQRTRQQAEADASQAVPLHQVVRQILAQPESVRAAFVLSEVLQRRDF